MRKVILGLVILFVGVIWSLADSSSFDDALSTKNTPIDSAVKQGLSKAADYFRGKEKSQ